MNRHFTFKLKDDIVRGMTRQQYKVATHYARLSARLIEAKINWDTVSKHLADVALYGRSEICLEDMLK